MNYFFHPGAQTEHLETVAYYESKRSGLGASYLAEFEKMMLLICEFPHRYPVELETDIKRKRMNQFPFSILFRVTVNSVQVLAVAHHRRSPSYWLDRL